MALYPLGILGSPLYPLGLNPGLVAALILRFLPCVSVVSLAATVTTDSLAAAIVASSLAAGVSVDSLAATLDVEAGEC